MKRIAALLLVILLTSIGCSSHNYNGWNTLSVGSCGTIKVPGDWTCSEKDGLVYIFDENQNLVMAETHTHSEDKGQAYVVSQTLSGTEFSNGAIYGEAFVKQGEDQTRKYYLTLGYEYGIRLIICDDTMNENTVKKIAASFVGVQG